MIYIRSLADLQVQADKLAELEVQKPKVKKDYMPSSYILKIQEKTTELHSLRKQNKKMKNAFIHHPNIEKISGFETEIETKISNSGVVMIDFDLNKGELFLLSTEDKTISIFNKEFSKIEASTSLAYEPITSFFIPKIDTDDNKRNILVVNSKGGINILSYDTELHQFDQTHEEQLGENLKDVQLHPLGFLILGLKGEDTWFIYDLRNKKMVYEGYSEGSLGMRIHCDGHIIALSGKDGKIRFINLCEGEEILVFDSKIVLKNSLIKFIFF